MVAVVVLVLVVAPHIGGHLLADGTVAPPITLTGDDGRHLDVRTLAAGRPVVVEFMETTCPTCQAKAADVCRLARTRSAALVVGVDAALEGADLLRGFRSQHLDGCAAATLPLLTDPGDAVTHAFKVGVVPTVYVIDRGWKVAYSGVGAAGVDGVGAVLDRLTGGGGG